MGISDYLKEFVESKVRKAVKMVEGEFVNSIVSTVKEFTNHLMRKLLATLIIASSIIIFALSAVFFGIEYLALSKTISLLIMGIILLLIGVVVKVQR